MNIFTIIMSSLFIASQGASTEGKAMNTDRYVPEDTSQARISCQQECPDGIGHCCYLQQYDQYVCAPNWVVCQAVASIDKKANNMENNVPQDVSRSRITCDGQTCPEKMGQCCNFFGEYFCAPDWFSCPSSA